MKKPLCRLSLMFILLLSLTSALFGETKTRIAIEPIDTRAASGYEKLGSTVQFTLRLVLLLTGRYEVPASDEPLKEGFTPDARISGALVRGENGFTMELRAVDGKSGQDLAAVQGEASSLFDIFELTDILTVGLLEGLTKEKFIFAGLTLENSGVPGPYEVFIDGTFIGSNLTDLPKIPAGSHSVEIKDVLPKIPQTIFAETVTLTEREAKIISFHRGLIPEDKHRFLSERDRKISLEWRGIGFEGQTIFGDIKKTLDLYPEGAIPEIREKYSDMEKSFWDARWDAPASQSISNPLKTLSKILPANKDASILNRLNQTKFIPHRQIDVDGKEDDWIGIDPIAQSQPDDKTYTISTGLDISQLWLSTDKDFLNILCFFNDGLPVSDTAISYELELVTLPAEKNAKSYTAKFILQKPEKNSSGFRIQRSLRESGGRLEVQYIEISFKNTGNLLEARFPISNLNQYFYNAPTSKCTFTVKDAQSPKEYDKVETTVATPFLF